MQPRSHRRCAGPAGAQHRAGGSSCMTEAPKSPKLTPETGGRSPPHPGESTGESLLSRRDFIRTTVRLAVAGAVIPGVLSQLLPSVAPASLGGGGAGPVI